jgi:hypothetical protein
VNAKGEKILVPATVNPKTLGATTQLTIPKAKFKKISDGGNKNGAFNVSQIPFP